MVKKRDLSNVEEEEKKQEEVPHDDPPNQQQAPPQKDDQDDLFSVSGTGSVMGARYPSNLPVQVTLTTQFQVIQSLDIESVTAMISSLMANGTNEAVVYPVQLFATDLHEVLPDVLAIAWEQKNIPYPDGLDNESWRAWPAQHLLKNLKIFYGGEGTNPNDSSHGTPEERIEKLNLEFDASSTALANVTAFVTSLGNLTTEFCQMRKVHLPTRDSELEGENLTRYRQAVDKAFERLGKAAVDCSPLGRLCKEVRIGLKAVKNFAQVSKLVLKEAHLLVLKRQDAQSMGMSFSKPAQPRQPDSGKRPRDDGKTWSHKPRDNKRHRPNEEDSHPRKGHRDLREQRDNKDPPMCNGCGRTGHVHAQCFLSAHPDFNRDKTKPWLKSKPGREWAARTDSFGKPFTTLPKRMSLSGAPVEYKEGEHTEPMALTTVNVTPPDPFVACTVYYRVQEEKSVTHEPREGVKAKMLVDSGAVNGSYISCRLLELIIKRWKLHRNKSLFVKDNTSIIIKSFSGVNTKIKTTLTIDIKFVNDNKEEILLQDVIAHVIPSHIDVIVGLPTIRKYDLLGRHLASLVTQTHSGGIVDRDKPQALCAPGSHLLLSLGPSEKSEKQATTTIKENIKKSATKKDNEFPAELQL